MQPQPQFGPRLVRSIGKRVEEQAWRSRAMLLTSAVVIAAALYVMWRSPL